MNKIYLVIEYENDVFMIDVASNINMLKIFNMYSNALTITGYKTKKEAINHVNIVKHEFLGL